MSNKKYNVETTCRYCGSPIIISYEKYRPFPKTPVTDVKLEITVGCSHIATGSIDGYVEMGREFLNMIENRRIDYQELEDKEHREKMRKILGEYDPDSEYNPSRF